MQVPHKRPLRQIARCLAAASALTLCSLAGPTLIAPAASAQAPAATRFVGTVTATAAGSLKVKTDAGIEHAVTVPDGIKLQRIAPGAKEIGRASCRERV